MPNLRETIERIFTTPQPLKTGVYRYQTPPEAEYSYRLHLRVEPNGAGLLIINAATVLHLNQSAAEYAYHMIQGSSDEVAAKDIASRYRVSADQALGDYRNFTDRVYTLIDTPDLDPVTYLDFERITPYTDLLAPLRLDCALTYSLPEGADPESAPLERVTRELSTDEWKLVIQIADSVGIPHLIFTGGEPTQREDLIELLNLAEEKGMVTGLISNGLRMRDDEYFNDILLSGLDHLMLILHPEQPESWQVLEKVLPADLFTAVHLTITTENADQTASYLERLAELRPNGLSISETDASLTDKLEEARQLAAELDLALVWDLPVPYTQLNPVALEIEPEEKSEGAANAWMYVEPDGDVLPAQGLNQPLGNILSEPWEKIWAAAH
jgi:organic radical activating enzyme